MQPSTNGIATNGRAEDERAANGIAAKGRAANRSHKRKRSNPTQPRTVASRNQPLKSRVRSRQQAVSRYN